MSESRSCVWECARVYLCVRRMRSVVISTKDVQIYPYIWNIQYIWISLVAICSLYESCPSHYWYSDIMNNSCASCPSHAKLLVVWVMSESLRDADMTYRTELEFCVTRKNRVMSTRCMSHVRVTVIHVSEVCCKCDSTISHMYMGRVANVNKTHRTYECVVSHMWMSDVTHVTESCRTYECVIGWVMSHLEWPLRMRVFRNGHNLDTRTRMHSVVWHTYTRTRI